MFYKSSLKIYPHRIESERTVYGILDILGDLGGVGEAIITALGILLLPISEFNFNMNAIKTLYLTRNTNQRTNCEHSSTTQ